MIAIPKKLIGWWFFITGFIGGMLLGYMQISKAFTEPLISQNAIMWIYSFVYISFLACFFALIDYVNRLEGKCQ